MTRKHINQAALFLLMAISIGLLNHRMENLGIKDFREPANRHVSVMTYMGMAGALSSMTNKLPADYTLYGAFFHDFVANQLPKDAPDDFDVAAAVNKVIARSMQDKDAARSGVMLIGIDSGGEDLGIYDFSRLAFSIFGFSFESLYYLWYLILAVSAFLFFWEFRDSPIRIGLAILLITAVIVALPIPVALHVDASVVSNRNASILSLIAALHVLLVLGRASKSSEGFWSQLPTFCTISQLLILFFCYQMRGATTWQFLAIIAMAVIAPLIHGYARGTSNGPTDRSRSPALRRSGLILLLVFVGFAALHMHRTRDYNEQYRVRSMGVHSTWHPLYSGFTAHPDVVAVLGQELHDFRVTDLAVVHAGERYFRDHRDRFVKPGVAIDGDYWDKNYNPWTSGNWRTYEKVMRAAYFDVLWNKPQFYFEAHIYKIRNLWRTIFENLRLVDPLSLLLLIPVYASLIFYFGKHGQVASMDRRESMCVAVACVVMFMASLIPAVAVAPIVHGMLDIFVMTTFLVFSLPFVVFLIRRAIWRQILPAHP